MYFWEWTGCPKYKVLITFNPNKWKFKIYRKPTSLDIIRHNSSFHSPSFKLAAFHSMIHRLLYIPMCPPDFLAKMHTIKSIASENGYNPIDHLLFKKKRDPNSHLSFTQTPWNHLHLNISAYPMLEAYSTTSPNS